MPRPNWAQWVVIWLTAFTAAHSWMRLQLSHFWPGLYVVDGSTVLFNGWGLPAYLYFASRNEPTKLATTIIVIGLLLVWQLGGGTTTKISGQDGLKRRMPRWVKLPAISIVSAIAVAVGIWFLMGIPPAAAEHLGEALVLGVVGVFATVHMVKTAKHLRGTIATALKKRRH